MSAPAPKKPAGAPAAPKSARRVPALGISLALVAATMLVYFPTWHYDFVNWDDPRIISENPHLVGGLTRQGLVWAVTAAYYGDWHPVTWLSHMLDVQLYGLNAGAHHVSNVLLHIANTLILFSVLRRLTGAVLESALVAGLFAVHPLHVESVAWLSARTDVVSTLFWMLALWAYERYAREPRPGPYACVLLLFALGLMSKPMVVTLPFALLLLDFWPLNRVRTGGAWPRWPAWPAPRTRQSAVVRLVLEKVPLFAIAVAASIVTVVNRQQIGSLGTGEAYPLGFRVANALVSYVVYLEKTLWPSGLAALYPYRTSIPPWWVLGSIGVLAVMTVLALRAARTYPYVTVGWLWYVGTLVPVIGLVQAGRQSMADRYSYIPLIGIFIMVVWGAAEVFNRWTSRRFALPATFIVVMSAFAVTARQQVSYWEDGVALWQHAVDVTTGNFVGHYSLGYVLAQRERTSEAIAQYAESLRIAPDFQDAHTGMGAALAKENRTAEAIDHYTRALRVKPDLPEAHNGMGNALMSQGKVAEAVAHYTEALRIAPDFADAHTGMGAALVKQERVDEAVHQFREALRLKPDPQMQRNLDTALALQARRKDGQPTAAGDHNRQGNLLAGEGKYAEAIVAYTEALRLDPGLAEAHNGLGSALDDQGKIEEAIAQYTEALRIKPDFASAHNNLGTALAKQGKRDLAIREFLEALRLEPNQAGAHYNVAVMLLEQGKTAEAAPHLEAASKLDPADQQIRRALDDIRRQGGR